MYVMRDGMGRRVKGDGGGVGECRESCWRSLLSRDGGNLLEEPTVKGRRELVGVAYF